MAANIILGGIALSAMVLNIRLFYLVGKGARIKEEREADQNHFTLDEPETFGGDIRFQGGRKHLCSCVDIDNKDVRSVEENKMLLPNKDE